MKFQINPNSYNSIFVVPADVVDRHIKLAGIIQLKALLWLMRRNGEGWEISDMSAALGAAEPDVKDALQYWVEAGILIKYDENPTSKSGSHAEEIQGISDNYDEETKKIEVTENSADIAAINAAGNIVNLSVSRHGNEDDSQNGLKAAVKRHRVETVQKPTRDEVARRGAESPESAFLLNEAQKKFGRNINQAEASTLVWLHDYEGLPVAVIIMIIEYIVSEGRGTIKYLEKTAVDWSEKDINTVEKAEKHICAIMSSKKAWGRVERAMSIDHRRPSAKEQQAADRWVNEWGFSQEMLRAAYDQCVDATTKISIPYINKILEKWHKSGIKTVAEAMEDSNAKKNAVKSQKSYDIEEIERRINEQYK